MLVQFLVDSNEQFVFELFDNVMFHWSVSTVINESNSCEGKNKGRTEAQSQPNWIA
jgi:hypothetical protein